MYLEQRIGTKNKGIGTKTYSNTTISQIITNNVVKYSSGKYLKNHSQNGFDLVYNYNVK